MTGSSDDTFLLGEQLRRQLWDAATTAAPHEAVGFLFGTTSGSKHFTQLTNSADDPTMGFHVEDFEVRAVLQREGALPLALFHSHPTDYPAPSTRDIDGMSAWKGIYHLIVSLAHEPAFRCWRVFDGQVYPITLV